jgi:hypothetical protein
MLLWGLTCDFWAENAKNRCTVARLERLRWQLGRFAVGCGGLGGVEEGEEDAAEGSFAAGGIVPLLEGVDAATYSTCSYSYCRYSSGERYVGIGRTEARFGAKGEMTVYGSEGVKDQ